VFIGRNSLAVNEEEEERRYIWVPEKTYTIRLDEDKLQPRPGKWLLW